MDDEDGTASYLNRVPKPQCHSASSAGGGGPAPYIWGEAGQAETEITDFRVIGSDHSLSNLQEPDSRRQLLL